jgi:hypothetical protein
MKILFMSGLLFLSSSLLSQNCIIKGKIIGFDLPEERIAYYALDNNMFNKENVFDFNEENDYLLEFSLASLNKLTGDFIYFSVDKYANYQEKYSCTYKMNLKNILRKSKPDTNGNIIVFSDLFISENCVEDIDLSSSASFDGLENFIGRYVFKNDEYQCVVLLKNNYSFIMEYSFPDGQNMTSESGFWNYDSNNNLLTLESLIKENLDLDLKIRFRIKNELLKDENAEVLTFQNDKLIMIKQ